MRCCWKGIGLVSAGALLLSGARAVAQWDPYSGQWGKTELTDVRVMTWNVQDGICSTNIKTEGANNWTALARIVAAMKPDVLVIQEAGDNDGNGTGTIVDTVEQLTATIDQFLHGGTGITAYVQAYAPDYDLPYVFVSLRTDGYNRNAALSRFPFADLNGDTLSSLSDVPRVSANTGTYPPGGNGGIRGFLFVEMDLDDAVYCGDLVVGAAHLKSGGDSPSQQERLDASQNVAYVIDYWYNGAGLGVPDPYGKINDIPPATTILDPYTPVVIGGDWNEDELYNGRRGPADWLTQAALVGGTDGTDRDRSDMTYDDARQVFSTSRNTEGSSKYDYLAWQDSIAVLRRAFIFNSTASPQQAYLPAEVQGFPSPLYISNYASDHRPVLADLVLPLCSPCLVGDSNCDGAVNNFDITAFVLALTDQAAWGAQFNCDFYCANDINGDGAVNNFDISPFVQLLTGP
jgi:endonuclease/exonuclease/phosphatase family metal-dependent hydrolase